MAMVAAKPASSLPLVLDLDGTLIHTDTFHEMMAWLLYKKPWALFLIPFWFLKGRPYTKRRLTEISNLLPHQLPYNLPFLEFAKKEAEGGRFLVLATGTDQTIAQKIADHLGFFQEVIGSDGHINMTGPHKRDALLKKFGLQGFDYAGDSQKDLYVWEVSRLAIVVHPKRGVLSRVLALKGVRNTHHFPGKPYGFWGAFRF